MFRYTSVSPLTYDPAGGPYNLGMLWANKLVLTGKSYYCPSYRPVGNVATTSTAGGPFSMDRVFERYDALDANKDPWPLGAIASLLDKNTVRSGYFYMPQETALANVSITVYGSQMIPDMPYGGVAANNPNATEAKWECLPGLKQSLVDSKRSMILDCLPDDGTVSFSHQTSSHQPSGLNVGFGDGHVRWQKYFASNPAFNQPFGIRSPTIIPETICGLS